MSRYKAAAIHFMGSLVVLSLIAFAVWTIWYPGKLIQAASGIDILKIVLIVDVIVGPIITLIIFNTKKKSLKFDMAAILVCQIVFMLYGCWTIFQARPVYVVFTENRFHVTLATEMQEFEQKKAKNPHYQTLPLFGPEYVSTKLPNDPKVHSDLVFASGFGMGAHQMPRFFVPYEELAEDVKKTGKAAKDVLGMNPDVMARLAAYEAKKNAENKKVLFLPLIAKNTVMQVAVDAKTGAIVDILS